MISNVVLFPQYIFRISMWWVGH